MFFIPRGLCQILTPACWWYGLMMNMTTITTMTTMIVCDFTHVIRFFVPLWRLMPFCYLFLLKETVRSQSVAGNSWASAFRRRPSSALCCCCTGLSSPAEIQNSTAMADPPTCFLGVNHEKCKCPTLLAHMMYHGFAIHPCVPWQALLLVDSQSQPRDQTAASLCQEALDWIRKGAPFPWHSHGTSDVLKRPVDFRPCCLGTWSIWRGEAAERPRSWSCRPKSSQWTIPWGAAPIHNPLQKQTYILMYCNLM